MTTYADVLKKHAGEKRCQHKSKQGCGQWKPLSEFPSTVRQLVSGPVVRYASWCIECQRERDRRRHQAKQYEKTGGKHGVQAEINHTGPMDRIERYFFCELRANNG